MVGFKELSGGFGVEITDIDLATATDAEIRQMLDIFYRNQLIMVKDQSLEFDRFDEITKKFGNQHPHFLDHLRMRGHPAILMLSNIYENGKQLGIHEGACFWHTDVAYQDPPNSTTTVYSIEQPKDGCPTHIADCFRAYDALSESMKQKIDELICVHHYGNRDFQADAKIGYQTRHEAETMTDNQKKKVKNVYHPLVMRHPITGRKSLYSVAGTSWGISGWPDDEAMDLLRELMAHCLQDKFVTTIDYEVGDLAAWDTFSTLHRATPIAAVEPDDPNARTLWRVSVNGISPLYSSDEIYQGYDKAAHVVR
jgi:taurine dioxygenase